MHILYRISDNGYPKEKFEYATKLYCLKNFFSNFWLSGAFITIFVDDTKLKPETEEGIKLLIEENSIIEGINLIKYTGGSSAASWRKVFNWAMDNLTDEDDVYFVEDDYLHRTHSAQILDEGLLIADYVSLYDHNDKYIPASEGGNHFVDEDGGEVTKVFRTNSTHWKFTNSTTMTFATNMKTLREDEPIWSKWTTGTHPNDFACFLELREKGRSLITPIPGYSTHCEPRWASPGINWRAMR